MAQSRVRLRPAADDVAYVEALLERNDLPSADVRSKPDCFFLATTDGGRVGVGGLEVRGSDALLRSIVVEEAVRGCGYGTGICEALEAEADRAGVETLYLLTTTAAAFFADGGFEEIERADAPPSIRETSQFADLCPDTATPMRKSV